MRFYLLFLCLALSLTGCAASSVPWQNPDLPASQWSQDWRACKRWSEQQVGFREEDSQGPFKDFDRATAKRQIDAYAGACMRERGYLPKGKS